jgi:hypothetical protein
LIKILIFFIKKRIKDTILLYEKNNSYFLLFW